MRGSPRFLGNPRVHALLIDPGEIDAAWSTTASMMPSVIEKTSALAMCIYRGSTTRPTHFLSTLRRVGSPRHDARLGSGCGPAWPGETEHSQGSIERFLRFRFPLSQASPGAIQCLPASGMDLAMDAERIRTHGEEREMDEQLDPAHEHGVRGRIDLQETLDLGVGHAEGLSV